MLRMGRQVWSVQAWVRSPALPMMAYLQKRGAMRTLPLMDPRVPVRVPEPKGKGKRILRKGRRRQEQPQGQRGQPVLLSLMGRSYRSHPTIEH